MSNELGSLPRRHNFGKAGELLTRSDTVDFDPIPRGVRFDAAGTVVILPMGMTDGDEFAINVQAGEVPPWHIKRVFVTGSADIAFHSVRD